MATLDLAPLVNQVIVPLLTPILAAGLMWIGYRVQSLFHVNILAGHRAVFETAVQNGISLVTKKLAGVPMSVDIKNATIAGVATYVAKTAPDALTHLGLDKDAQALATAIEARLPTT